MNIRNLIYEELEKYFVEEDYPSSFSHEEFAKLRTFADRVKYCEQHLQKMAAGSSRIVYKIDEEKVLKLAKNAKGIAQNQLEASIGSDNYFTDIAAKIFNSGQNDQWVEMELAKKLTPTKFKQITGCDIRQLDYYLRNRESDNNGKRQIFDMENNIVEYYNENEFAAKIVELMFNYDMPAGDLGRLSSYGEVIHDGQPTVVVTD